MKIVSQIKDMGFLLTSKIVSLDIESDTDPKGPAAPLGKAYGLSYNADIIAISLYAGPKHPTAVFLDVDKYTNDQKNELRDFLMKVMCRDVLLLGHNGIFDIRSLGGHFGFTLPRQTKIWDTMIMQRKLLLIDVPSIKIQKGYFGLLNVARKWQLLSEDEDYFLEFMKQRRGSMSEFLDATTAADEAPAYDTDGTALIDDGPEIELSENLDAALDEALEAAGTDPIQSGIDLSYTGGSITEWLDKLPPSDVIWKFAGGFAPNRGAQKARLLLETYVAYDSVLCWQIYHRQIAFAEAVSSCGDGKTVSPMENVNVPYWPNLMELIEGWTNQLRIDGNMAILGVPVDMKYLKQRMEETKEKALELAPKLVFENDPTDPYPEFKGIFSQLVWYSMILEKANNPKTTYSNPVDGWVNWKHIPLDPSIIEDAIICEDRDAARRWAEWLVSLDPTISGRALVKEFPDTRIAPRLDLKLWMQQQCFSHLPDVKGKYFAHLKTRWLRSFYRLREKKDAIKLASALHFKPFYMFVIAGWPLFSDDDLKYELSLGTKKFQQERSRLERLDQEFSLQDLAIKMDAFSCGKKTLDWIFKKIKDWKDTDQLDDYPEYAQGAAHLTEYETLLSSWATHKRMVEYYLHAQRDGRIHSLLVPSTVTGRDNSTLPNLQNIKMADFAGIFVAPEGFTLVELDLSNAENMMSGMISGDVNFIMAIMIGDYHLNQAHLYWPKIMTELEKIADPAKRAKAIKKQRNKGKSATFALPYGAGEKKMISLLGVTPAEARDIIRRLNDAYPDMARKKEDLQKHCNQRVQNGRLPAYTTLWDKSRCFVETYQGRIQGYTIWNYVLQGGVASIVHPAMVEMETLFEEKCYKTHILLSVHDSIILAVDNREFHDTNVIQECCAILGRQVPGEILNRTIPGVVFASDYTPDNQAKWGLRIDQEYPLATDTIINEWGSFPLEQSVSYFKNGEHETWKGPMHQGWTLEREIAERKTARETLHQQPEALVAVESVKSESTMMTTLDWPREFELLLKETMANKKLSYRDAQGKERVTPILDMGEFAKVAEAMHHRGDPIPQQAVIDALQAIQNWLQQKLAIVTEIKQEVGG